MHDDGNDEISLIADATMFIVRDGEFNAAGHFTGIPVGDTFGAFPVDDGGTITSLTAIAHTAEEAGYSADRLWKLLERLGVIPMHEDGRPLNPLWAGDAMVFVPSLNEWWEIDYVERQGWEYVPNPALLCPADTFPEEWVTT